ncbi:hypothetical protein [Flavobacterium sp. XGLA_31]|uniref:hypothetical protein n=1 Tax=Flavobacterium sp. XGLA_31 TaxID=3447666 RepID=UPI003F33F96B
MKPLLSFTMLVITLSVWAQSKKEAAFIPKGYVLFEKIYGDLNNDHLTDCILIIKATDKTQIVTNDYDQIVDRNRRGLIVLLNQKGNYQAALKNYNCFASENEDGGVYMPPELSLEIKKGKLYIHYGHGRYGYWRYTFKFNHSDFDLIGYDAGYRSSFESDYVTFDETSINFITKKKQIKKVIKVSPNGKESYKETWKSINPGNPIKLSTIKDFEELDINS